MKLTALAVLASVAALSACAAYTSLTSPIAATRFDPAACSERRFDVYFDETQVSPEAREAIEAMERQVHGCRIDKVRIVGFDEAQADPSESMEASEARAEAVAGYLVAHTTWPRSTYELVARGDARAMTDQGQDRPMRRRARVIVSASAP
jgi:outer membrane protein OmpA-like peptidoglycan-associated protein